MTNSEKSTSLDEADFPRPGTTGREGAPGQIPGWYLWSQTGAAAAFGAMAWASRSRLELLAIVVLALPVFVAFYYKFPNLVRRGKVRDERKQYRSGFGWAWLTVQQLIIFGAFPFLPQHGLVPAAIAALVSAGVFLAMAKFWERRTRRQLAAGSFDYTDGQLMRDSVQAEIARRMRENRH